MNQQADMQGAREPRGRVWGWVRAALVLLLMPFALAWALGGWSYYVDVLAVYQLQISLLVGLIALVLLVLRCWRSGAALLVLSIIGLWVVVQGRAWALPEVDFTSKPDDVIRVVSCNINPENPDWRTALDQLLDLDADVVVVLEAPWVLTRSIIREGYLENSAYPHYERRLWVDKETSPCIVISRWPQQRLEVGPEAIIQQQVLHTRIEHPAGPVVVGPLHPLSPRDRARWDAGNRAIDLQARCAEGTLRETGLPLIMCADLNAGPGQLRARTIKSTGMRMSKPVLRAAGSFPEGGDLPGMLMLQLDDCWHSGGVRPVAWSMFPVIGSDHRAVVVDFRLDQP